MARSLVAAVAATVAAAAPRDNEVLIFTDDFSTLNLSVWKHELTLSGGGNWEFEGYTNNRSVSRAVNGSLIISPTLLSDAIGSANVVNGYTMDIWGGDPASACTGNLDYGCLRTSGAGGNVLNPVQSAKLRSAESFAFTYGRVEVVAQLPRGDWLWPAIWLLPVNQNYGPWPASGEIDIMESRGNARGYPGGGVEAFASTLHWGPYWPADPYLKTHAEYSLPSGDLSQAMHTYGFVWNATRMYTYIDAESNVVLDVDLTGTSFWEMGNFTGNNPWALGGGAPNAPFDQRFYLIIEVAVGGTGGYFPDGVGGKPWSDASPNAINEFFNAESQWWPTWTSPMMVDSVNVWQAPGGDYAFRPMM